MARPKKNTVEYFPHYCDHKKTMFIIEQQFGNNGYAFWFKLLELLGKTEGHYLNVNDLADWEYLVSYTSMDAETCTEILNLLSRLAAIDGELWGERIIWCQNFVDNIEDVYKKRSTVVPTKPSFRDGNPPSGVVSGEKTLVSVTETTQSKGKETKVKEIIVNESTPTTIYQFYSDNFPGTLTSIMSDKLEDYSREMEEALMLDAMNKCVENDKRTFSYLEAILRNYSAAGIQTLKAAKEAEDAYKKKKQTGSEKPLYKKYEPGWLDEKPTEKGMAASKEIMEEMRQKLGGIKGG